MVHILPLPNEEKPCRRIGCDFQKYNGSKNPYTNAKMHRFDSSRDRRALGGRNKLLCSASPAGSFVSEKVLTYSKNVVPKQCFLIKFVKKHHFFLLFVRGGNNISGRAVCIPNVRCRTQQFIPPP